MVVGVGCLKELRLKWVWTRSGLGLQGVEGMWGVRNGVATAADLLGVQPGLYDPHVAPLAVVTQAFKALSSGVSVPPMGVVEKGAPSGRRGSVALMGPAAEATAGQWPSSPGLRQPFSLPRPAGTTLTRLRSGPGSQRSPLAELQAETPQ